MDLEIGPHGIVIAGQIWSTTEIQAFSRQMGSLDAMERVLAGQLDARQKQITWESLYGTPKDCSISNGAIAKIVLLKANWRNSSLRVQYKDQK